jgi:2-hydroxychromene-2-carboxylate isomerase
MGEVIWLDQRRLTRGARHDRGAGAGRETVAPTPATLWFDLGSPATYFAAERAERMFPGLSWRPVLSVARGAQGPASAAFRERAARMAIARAAELRMPLVWPESHPDTGRAAMRVAAYAAERAQASAFVLAASRLAFCGGFDLHDPEILAEAAAAAALPLDECLLAAGDRSRDEVMEAAGRDLAARGVDRLPVLEVGARLFCGEERLAQAAAAVRDPLLPQRPTPLGRSAG